MLSRRKSAPSEAHPPDLICTLTITLSKIAQAAALLSHDMVWKSGLGKPNAAVLPAAHYGEPRRCETST
jgi:hypothetical protein